MIAPNLMAPTSSHHAFVSAILAVWKVFRVCQTLAQTGSGDLVKGHAGEAHDSLHSINEPVDLSLDGWPNLSWPRLKIRALQPASGAALITHTEDPCPEMGLPPRAHAAVRKEGM